MVYLAGPGVPVRAEGDGDYQVVVVVGIVPGLGSMGRTHRGNHIGVRDLNLSTGGNKMSELKQPTKEQVLRAVGACGEANEILRILYPAAFEVKEEWADVTGEIKLSPYGYVCHGGWTFGDLRTFPGLDTWSGAMKSAYRVEGSKLFRRKK